MGTRNLTIVKKDGEYKIAKYCQWDGYPSGQGITLLRFLWMPLAAQLPDAVDRAVVLPPVDVDALWTECGAEGALVSMDVSDTLKKKYPQLHRDIGGGEFLTLLVQAVTPTAIENRLDFAADSLLCEWAYVIDLDEGTFDVFGGFNITPLTESDRFFFLMEKTKTSQDTVYYPVKFKAGWLLSQLPTEHEFLATLEPEEEQDEY